MTFSIIRLIFSLFEAGLFTLLLYFIIPKKNRLDISQTGLFFIGMSLISYLFLRDHLLLYLLYNMLAVGLLILLGRMPVYVASISVLVAYILNLIGSLISIIFAIYFYKEQVDYRFVLEVPLYHTYLLKLFVVLACLYIYKIFNALFNRKTKVQKINPRPVIFANFTYIIFIIFLSCELIQYIPTIYLEVLKIESLGKLLFTGIFMAYVASIFMLYIVNIYLFKSSDYLSIKLSSETDALTGVLNRKAGITYLNDRMQQVQQKKGRLTVCFIDVNNLKTVNDNFGHKMGDDLICETSRIIDNALREGDEIARLGGDEFIVVFSDCDVEQGIRVWNRILEKFETFNMTQKKTYDISVSVGFAEYNHKMTCTSEELIEAADQEMYKHKAKYKRMKGSRHGKW